jgi:hypothetical protein
MFLDVGNHVGGRAFNLQVKGFSGQTELHDNIDCIAATYQGKMLIPSLFFAVKDTQVWRGYG